MKPRAELSYLANGLRRRFGEDLTSPVDVFAILRSQEQLTLVHYPCSERISGMCILTPAGSRMVAINSSLSFGRQRFTAAHELYHLFIQEEVQSTVCGREIGAGRGEEEMNADGFASFFLAPNDALRSFIDEHLKAGREKGFGVEEVVRIEQHFRMSRQAVLYRLVGDGFITRDLANTLKQGIRASARKLGFSDELYLPTPAEQQYYTTGYYIELAHMLAERALISSGKYEELLLDAYRSDMVYPQGGEDQEAYD